MNGVTAYQTAKKGMSGLMSGLDTDTIIKGMTASTTNRISKLLQSKQKNSWKIDAFQDITSRLTGFKSKYFDVSSPTSLYSEKFFQGANVSAGGSFAKYIKVTGNSSTAKNLSIVGVKKNASTSSLVGDKSLSDNKIETGVVDFSTDGKVINNVSGQNISVSYEGKKYNITLGNVDFAPGATDAEKTAQIQTAVNDAMSKTDIGGGKNLGDKFEMTVAGDKFSLSAKVQSDGSEVADLTIDGANDKILKALGMKVGSVVKKDAAVVGETIDPATFETKLNFRDTMVGKSMTFNLNGVKKEIIFDASMRFDNAANFAEDLNKKLSSAFGNGRVKVEANADNSFSFGVYKNSGGNMVLDGTSILGMTSSSGDVMGNNGVFNMEQSASSRISLTDSLSTLNNSPFKLDANGKGSLTANGVTIDYTGDDSIQTIISKINHSDAGVEISYMSTSDTFSATAKASGAAGSIDIKDVNGNFAANIFGTATAKAGQDAEIEISYDGGKTTQILQRDSNTFSLDGMTITLENGADTAGISPTDPVTFTSTANTDDIIKNIKNMINDYNDLTALVNKQLGSKPNRNYAPLTDEQKKDMTEKQIADWEIQAKAGLLYGDSDLRTLTSELRFVFSFDVNGASSLKDMGITTSSAYGDNGKIILDESKLKAALETDIEGVKAAFTTASVDPASKVTGEKGFMQRVGDIVTKYAKSSGDFDNMGILVKKAGYKDATYTMNTTLNREQASFDEELSKLKRTLKSQEDRYYAEFTRLETYINQMNAQSGWLSQNA